MGPSLHTPILSRLFAFARWLELNELELHKHWGDDLFLIRGYIVIHEYLDSLGDKPTSSDVERHDGLRIRHHVHRKQQQRIKRLSDDELALLRRRPPGPGERGMRRLEHARR